MDRAWRQASTESLEAIADPNLTARQKFWKGAYTYQGITTHLSNTMKDKQSKVQFLEDLLNRKQEFEKERDQLLLKKLEMSVMRSYNMYRVPFLALMSTLCLLSVMRTRMNLVIRFAPPLVTMPFIHMYNQHIGQYGVHRRVDLLLSELREDKLCDEDSEIKL